MKIQYKKYKESSMNMKKLQKYKNDLLMILLYSAIYITIALILTHGKFLFASKIDFEMQHYIFPEYFRNLFYETKDLLPDFALNIGGGQNIYNFSYYGLLNPFILISYLLPGIPMIYYLIGVSFVIAVSSTFLFYKFLKSHNFKNSTCVIVSLLFLFATPIIYHAKRHIMFINYFPFLIGGLFGVDNFIKKKKIGLLITCTTLMIFTSFYYSVAGIVVLIIYGIYSYLKENKKGIIKFLIKFIVPFIISILISAIILLPTAYALLSGRGETVKTVEMWLLLIPNFKFLFNAYGPGLTLFEFILICILIIDKDIKKETRILALSLIIIFLFPVFNYILNGTLYVNSKSLIPFLPLALLLIAISMETLLKNHKKVRYYLVLSTCLITIGANFNDILISKETVRSSFDKDYQSLINNIATKDNDFYRIENETYLPSSLNKVFTMNEYKSSVYASTQNRKYQTWVQQEQKSNQIYRNNMMLSLAGNPIAEAMMGEKYIVSAHKLNGGYKLIDKKGKLYLYENEFALPVIYASKVELTEKEVQKLQYPENVIAEYTKDIPKENVLEKVDLEIKNKKNLEITKESNGVIKIRAGKNAKMTVVPNENLDDKILFVTFKNKFNRRCHHEKRDQIISINHVINKLTCSNWKYHNKNYVFHYVLMSPKQLDITFSEAYYKLGNIEVYAIPKKLLLDRKKEIIPIKIYKKETKGDKIVGTINTEAESKVEVAIPYDKGFSIIVDGKEIKYQESIQNGITFTISKGKHKIEIVYESPWKDIASVISIIGILLWIGIIIKERKLSYIIK